MVLVAFPLAKLGFLLLKQLSRPLANYIKNEAKSHPFARKYLVVPTGRVFHKLYAISDKTATSTPLSEADAVDLGASALGEIILFTLLSIVLIFELGRQSDKKAIIKKNKEEEITNIKESLSDLSEDMVALNKKVKLIERQIKGTISSLDLEEYTHEAAEDNNFFDKKEQKRYFSHKPDPVDDSA